MPKPKQDAAVPEPQEGYYGNTDDAGVIRGQAELDKLRAIPSLKTPKAK